MYWAHFFYWWGGGFRVSFWAIFQSWGRHCTTLHRCSSFMIAGQYVFIDNLVLTWFKFYFTFMWFKVVCLLSQSAKVENFLHDRCDSRRILRMLSIITKGVTEIGVTRSCKDVIPVSTAFTERLMLDVIRNAVMRKCDHMLNFRAPLELQFDTHGSSTGPQLVEL